MPRRQTGHITYLRGHVIKKLKLKRKTRSAVIIITAALCCALMAYIDGVLTPPYAVKSLCKLAVFGAIPLLYTWITRDRSLLYVLKPKRRGVIIALIIGVALYAVILGAFLLLRGVFDFSAVTKSLTSGVGVTRDNFIYVALYISVINSFLEEFFFRGFAFITLRKTISRPLAYMFGALIFALYHVAMTAGWFGAGVFILMMTGLAAGAVIFSFLDERYGDIYSSWIVHMFTNLATNTIGCILFGII